MGIGGQKLILGGLVCPTGQGTCGLDTLRGRCLLLGSGRLTLCRLGAFIGTAGFAFRICKEIEPPVSHVPFTTFFQAKDALGALTWNTTFRWEFLSLRCAF